ncbi:malate dehydrogenase (quinone) [Luteolibacter ambystomatis]|uniref:Probable malate:quinone oxidoreductase n=1 Tax=Luteolibacter ambystomatis TaxID=2824561 RepID=A0A975PFP8_9BACT|nr:malate dehydrogenase (quinone) [Luteolibacter ambystomatis]QUE52015.1 malate dehydrogenase (quinone) [Luteolibacter ambystomatis]
MSSKKKVNESPDAVLVGAGIMSATLGVLLKELRPDMTLVILEGLSEVAQESSSAWNNAGTGHAALCELNYTPEKKDGSIDVSKAIQINESFELSKQLWASLVQRGTLGRAGGFLTRVPHLSFVHGRKNVEYLRKRHEALKDHPFFREMEFTEDPATMAEWMPLIMQDRDPKEPVAATRVESGTDVDFGALTKAMIEHLKKLPGVTVHTGHQVANVYRSGDDWTVEAEPDFAPRYSLRTKFVFLGAGGGALPLLQMSGIPEGKGFGGFPVSGQWLRCDNPELVDRHFAKVYGKASVGAPPMSVPHLDTRIINGKRSLLFGPYAGFTTKYLKSGSLLDLPMSFRPDNFIPMVAAGLANFDLTKYLIGQVIQSPEERLEALKEFVPDAKMEDWHLAYAGQRVQIIKKDKKKGGILQFGTEVVSAEDGSIAALLGASPGASTAVGIMLQLIGKCFPEEMKSQEWTDKLKALIPAYGESMAGNPELYRQTRAWTAEVLGLKV